MLDERNEPETEEEQDQDVEAHFKGRWGASEEPGAQSLAEDAGDDEEDVEAHIKKMA